MLLEVSGALLTQSGARRESVGITWRSQVLTHTPGARRNSVGRGVSSCAVHLLVDFSRRLSQTRGRSEVAASVACVQRHGYLEQ